jgi:hypothetical protein
MRQMMQKSKAHRAIFSNPQIAKFFQIIAFNRPVVPLVKSNINGDEIFQWETLPNPINPKTQLGDMVSSLEFVTLRNGIWLNPEFWINHATEQGWMDAKGNDLKYVFMPVRINNDDYWILLNELWRMLYFNPEQRQLTGLLPNTSVAQGHKPLFFSWSKLLRAMGAPTKQKRTIEGTGWESVLSPQNVREFIILTFTQDGKQSGIPVLTGTDAYQAVFSQVKNSAKAIQILGFNYLINWVGRILVGQQVPITTDPSKVDMKKPLAAVGGVSVPFMTKWHEQTEKSLTSMKQVLLTTTTEWRTRDEELLRSNFWSFTEQGQLGDEKTLRGWLVSQEKTGMIYFAEKKKSVNNKNKNKNKNKTK